MNELLENPYWAAAIIFVFQSLFIYLRTINIIYTAERKVWPAVLSNVGVSLSVLFSFAVGTKSILDGNLLPIILFAIGAAIGTYIGIKQNIKKDEKQNIS